MREPFVNARFYHQPTGDSHRLKGVLAQALTPLTESAS